MVAVLLTAAPALSDKPPACTPVMPTARVSQDTQTVPEATIINGVRTATTVHLNGTPSQPGNEVTYFWEQLSGPTVTLSSATDSKPTFTAPDVGPGGATLVFQLTVTDCSGNNKSSVTTPITVTNVLTNRPPTAVATVDGVTFPYSVNEGMTVTLNGSASSDPDGDILSYVWTQLPGGTPVTITPGSNGFASFTAPPEQYPNGETLTFRLTVSDNSLSSSTDILVTVQSVNQTPVAAISCPLTVNEGSLVTLDGSASSDPDSGPLTYLWSQTHGVPNVDLAGVVLTGPSLVVSAPALTLSPYDTMTFGLQVIDNGNLAASTTCKVKVLDITPPVISSVNDMTAEATSASGASVLFDPTANDAFYGDVAVTCTPASGTTFALGTTKVSCSASDMAEPPNTATSGFSVTVADTTPPVISAQDDLTAEATSKDGAAVSYTSPATSDAVDGAGTAACLPASGSTFALGTSTVTCNATDNAGNAAVATTFKVTVQDTTPPVIEPHADLTAEATSKDGAAVSYTSPATSDAVDGPGTATCLPASGSTFALGTSTVTCNAKDNAGNAAVATTFRITVQDTTPPALTLPLPIGPIEGNTLGGANVTYAVSANDLVDGAVPVTCDKASGSLFPVGTTTVTCSASDVRSNKGTASFTVTVKDTTAPVIEMGATMAPGASYYFGSVPPAPTCTASDIVSGTVSCTVSGYSTAVGRHTLVAAATDAAGNRAEVRREYEVLAWTLKGFYQPVDMSTPAGLIYNTVKNGSTVPFKFEVFSGATELTDPSATVKSIQYSETNCVAAAITDDMETTATGNTVLRYDATAGQFVYNWKTPATSGKCYRVTMTTQDLSTLVAYFKLK